MSAHEQTPSRQRPNYQHTPVPWKGLDKREAALQAYKDTGTPATTLAGSEREEWEIFELYPGGGRASNASTPRTATPPPSPWEWPVPTPPSSLSSEETTPREEVDPEGEDDDEDGLLVDGVDVPDDLEDDRPDSPATEVTSLSSGERRALPEPDVPDPEPEPEPEQEPEPQPEPAPEPDPEPQPEPEEPLDPWEGMDPLSLEMLGGALYAEPDRKQLEAEQAVSRYQVAEVSYPSFSSRPAPKPVGPFGESLFGKDAVVVRADESPNVVVLVPCRTREQALNPHLSYADKDQLSKSMAVVIRHVEPKEQIRVWGEPTTQTAIPVRCRCLQTPCQYELPDDWVATGVNPAEPALATSLWSLPTMMSSSLFGEDAQKQHRLEFMQSSVLSLPGPGDLEREMPDLYSPPLPPLDNTASGFGASLSSLGSLPGDGGAPTGDLDGLDLTRASIRSQTSRFGQSTTLPAVTPGLESTSVLSYMGSESMSMYNSLTAGNPAMSPLAFSRTSGRPAVATRTSGWGPYGIGYGNEGRQELSKFIRRKVLQSQVWAAHDRDRDAFKSMFPDREFRGLAELFVAQVTINTAPKSSKSRKSRSKARSRKGKRRGGGGGGGGGAQTGTKLKLQVMAVGSCFVEGNSAWAEYSAKDDAGRPVWKLTGENAGRIHSIDVHDWPILIKLSREMEPDEPPFDAFVHLLQACFPGSTDGLWMYLHSLVDWSGVARQFVTAMNVEDDRERRKIVLPPLGMEGTDSWDGVGDTARSGGDGDGDGDGDGGDDRPHDDDDDDDYV